MSWFKGQSAGNLCFHPPTDGFPVDVHLQPLPGHLLLTEWEGRYQRDVTNHEQPWAHKTLLAPRTCLAPSIHGRKPSPAEHPPG